MNEQTQLERVLDSMRQDAPHTLSPQARARIVAQMQAQVRAVPALRRRALNVRRLIAGGSFALVAASVWLFRVPEEQLQITGDLAWTGRDLVEQQVHGAGAFEVDGELRVPRAGSAELTTPAGVRVRADADTKLKVRESARRVLLDRGAVHCRVPPLGPTGSFVVAAGSAQVIVHGTDFSVALRDSDAPCVRVREGRVEVRTGESSVFLTAGQSAGCEVVRAVEPPTPVVVPATQVEPAPVVERVHRHHHRHRARTLTEPTSTLDKENALLAEALHAERDRERSRALSLFEELLRRYPQSPLAPEAKAGVERNAH